jgi:hypothetical protein
MPARCWREVISPEVDEFADREFFGPDAGL